MFKKIILIFLVFSNFCYASEQGKIEDYYKKLSIYKDKGKIDIYEVQTSGAEELKSQFRFETSFERSKNFSMLWYTPFSLKGIKMKHGKILLNYGKNKEEEVETLKDAIVRSAGVSYGVASLVPPLLFGEPLGLFQKKKFDGECYFSNEKKNVVSFETGLGCYDILFNNDGRIIAAVSKKNFNGQVTITKFSYEMSE